MTEQDPDTFTSLTRSEQDHLYYRLQAVWRWREECGYTRRLFVANLNGRGIPVTYNAWCKAERDWEYGIRYVMHKYPDLWEVAQSLLYRRTARKDDPT